MNASHVWSGSLLAIVAALLLSACDDGGDSTTAPVTPSAASITGTVADGGAVAGALVMASDINGKTATATADANGSYTLDVSTLTAPVGLVATDPSGQVGPMTSLLAALPAAGSTAVANVTTLTTALSALLTTDGNPLDFVTPGAATGLGSVTAASLQKATATLTTYLGNLLSANKVTPTSFDPVSTPFTADHTGEDAVIDLLSVVQRGALTSLVYAAASGSAAGLTLSQAGQTTPPAPLPAPSAALIANQATLSAYLSALPASLATCLAGSSSQTCTALFDAAYKDNGYATIQSYDSDLSNPALALGAPQVALLAADGSSAMIRIPYSIGSGTGLAQYAVVTTVHAVTTPITLPSGTQVSWNIIGNQLKYDASITTRVTRRMFHDTYTNSYTGGSGKPDVNFYDAGLNLNFNINGPNATNVNSVLISGPGLPAGGLYLMRSSVIGAAMSIASTQPSTPPLAGAVTGSNTNEFRWSWKTLNSADTFTPPTYGYWSTQPVEVAQIPTYASYQYTLFDGDGNQLDQLSVINTTPTVDASVGAQTPWPTIGSDVVADFLSASGSLAGAVASVPVDFTTAPYEPAIFNVSIQSQNNTGAGSDGGTALASGALSVTVAAPTCTPTACPFVAVNTSLGAYRVVQLRARNPFGVRFYDNENYRNSDTAPNAS